MLRKWLVLGHALFITMLIVNAAIAAPDIKITLVPWWGGGSYTKGAIEGVVSGIDEPNLYSVVIYALTDVWWVQPRGDMSDTKIQSDGTWSIPWTASHPIHLGFRYAALLVKKGEFDAPADIPEGQFPPGGIVAHTIAYPVTEIFPTRGSPGTVVTIWGDNFGAQQGASTVTFGADTRTFQGGVDAGSAIKWFNQKIEIKVPPAATSGAILVTIDGQKRVATVTPRNNERSILPEDITFEVSCNDVPIITSISPTEGPVGTPITIMGDCFHNDATVTIGGVEAEGVKVETSKKITAIVSPDTPEGLQDVVATNPNGKSGTSEKKFNVLNGNGPKITSISPTAGWATDDTPITISGENFHTGITVTIGENNVPPERVEPDGKKIILKAPLQPGCTKDVRVTNPDGKSDTLKNGFAYVGDVNSNGMVDVIDSLFATQIAVKFDKIGDPPHSPTEQELCCADVNKDGEVNIIDALLIRQKAVGITVVIPAPSKATVNSLNPITLRIPKVTAKVGKTLLVPVQVDDIRGVAGAEIILRYDRTSLIARHVQTGNSTANDVVANTNVPGTVIISLLSLEGLEANEGTLVIVSFDTIGDAPQSAFVVVEDALLIDKNAQPIPVRLVNDAFQSVQLIPNVSLLGQNYPNPFNPETWIPYQLAEDAEVVIWIYNTTGQVVRTLNIGHKKSGIHISKERAAYWDGKDGNSEPVASGVYFYTIRAGNFTATKKLVVLK